MQYPNITQYKEAIQDADSFDELSNGISTVMGVYEPQFSSGNYAVVFKMNYGGKQYALKCFTRDVSDRNYKQNNIVDYINKNPSKYFIDYKYLEKELWVNDSDFPITWMEWIDAPTLGEKIKEFCKNNDKLSLINLSYNFKEFSLWILKQPFAHGDLKHDNLLVKDNGDLVMVDYDGMFIPEFKGKTTNEGGGKSYQHPLRTASMFNENLDDFSLLI